MVRIIRAWKVVKTKQKFWEEYLFKKELYQDTLSGAKTQSFKPS